MATSTPWGASQHTTQLLCGVRLVSTASHGGLMITAKYAENIFQKLLKTLP